MPNNPSQLLPRDQTIKLVPSIRIPDWTQSRETVCTSVSGRRHVLSIREFSSPESPIWSFRIVIRAPYKTPLDPSPLFVNPEYTVEKDPILCRREFTVEIFPVTKDRKNKRQHRDYGPCNRCEPYLNYLLT